MIRQRAAEEREPSSHGGVAVPTLMPPGAPGRYLSQSQLRDVSQSCACARLCTALYSSLEDNDVAAAHHLKRTLASDI